ncbi:hypothetical protein JSQ81_04120 [Sporosarcina sp. Marseille-Q4063]|uniref:hypothetical protein n=1 Tax=Sporosarcina sp. Marseille-Q4063 TaxID=2810514 RepID=UPI001BAFB7FE|nr:hypothetical protein [Sporosarcina sp. Marseille-Q4063]QUW22778.1 hypothetical protein JSQ81_04120 [Sporosarcina sp. Marseille-Q4063]
MDKRLQKIADDIKVKFGLDNYNLETHSIHKERTSLGEAYYKFNMEFFPNELSGELEEDLNPAGTAIVDYNIQKEIVESVIFVEDKSLSTMIHFPGKTEEEVGYWLESETGLTYGNDFVMTEVLENGFHFSPNIRAVEITPVGMIDVEFDNDGKLTSYNLFDPIPTNENIELAEFTLTLEEIEPLVKKQLQLVNFPVEAEKKFVPVYAMEEVYVTLGGSRVIPFLDHEREEVKVDEIIEWNEPLKEELARGHVDLVSEATADEAFEGKGIEEKLVVTADQIEKSKDIVRDVFRSEYPEESGMWKLDTLERLEHFIKATCSMDETAMSVFNRKLVVLINPDTMTLLNYVDNGEVFEIFDTFEPAEKAVVSHEDAFEKLVSYISLAPTYVYDSVTEKYILCGLLDAAEGVNAITGEVVPLSDF